MNYSQWARRPAPIRCPICDGPATHYQTLPKTAMGWGGPTFDADGRPHFHDPNGSGAMYYCAQGHDWERAPCWCGWARYDPKAEYDRQNPKAV